MDKDLLHSKLGKALPSCELVYAFQKERCHLQCLHVLILVCKSLVTEGLVPTDVKLRTFFHGSPAACKDAQHRES